jgi:hypothetical protein
VASRGSERRRVELCESPCGTATRKRLDVFLLVFDDLEVDQVVGTHGAGGGIKCRRKKNQKTLGVDVQKQKAYLLSWSLDVVPTDSGVAW